MANKSYFSKILNSVAWADIQFNIEDLEHFLISHGSRSSYFRNKQAKQS